MDRTAKEDLVASLHRTFSETAVVLVSHYSGLTVAEMGDLRRKMRDAGAAVKVAKNRLACRALAGTPYEDLAELFKGPTAIAFANDPVATAKVAVTYAKTNPKLILLGGGLGRHMLDAEGVRSLAALPSLDELRGTLLGLLSAPATRIAGLLQAPGGQLARVLAAYADAEGPGREAA
jgi:large subunit ribosomal protein L10